MRVAIYSQEGDAPGYSIRLKLELAKAGVEVIERSETEGLLLLIGSSWKGNKAEADLAASVPLSIARGRRVIPVLVQGRTMPSAADLPEALRMLATLNAATLRHESFGRDVATLVADLRKRG